MVALVVLIVVAGEIIDGGIDRVAAYWTAVIGAPRASCWLAAEVVPREVIARACIFLP